MPTVHLYYSVITRHKGLVDGGIGQTKAYELHESTASKLRSLCLTCSLCLIIADCFPRIHVSSTEELLRPGEQHPDSVSLRIAAAAKNTQCTACGTLSVAATTHGTKTGGF